MLAEPPNCVKKYGSEERIWGFTAALRSSRCNKPDGLKTAETVLCRAFRKKRRPRHTFRAGNARNFYGHRGRIYTFAVRS